MDPTPVTVNVNIFPDTIICTGLVTPIPLVNPFWDVVTPVIRASPTTWSFDVGVVVPMPILFVNQLVKMVIIE